MIRLEVLSGQDVGRVVESRESAVRIGRAPLNDLVLSEWHVSGEHASLALVGDRYVVRDHNSTNGTRVRRNGAETIRVAENTELEAGDVLELGDPERPVRVSITIAGDEPVDSDETRIVAARSIDDVGKVEQQADRDLLRRLYEAQKKISATIEIDDLLDVVADEIFTFLSRATHVTVALEEEQGSTKYVPVGTRVRGGGEGTDPIPITRSVFKKVVTDRAAVLAADAKREVGETQSLMAARILSTIGVPLWLGEEIIGILQVDNRASQGLFKETDLDVLAVLAQTTSQAFNHARLYRRLKLSEERQRTENVYLKKRDKSQRFDGIIGESGAMKKVFEHLKKVVDTRVTVLIEGETGTGKELVASAVHYWSQRRDKLFVAQNCAAMPENLLESELFGHKKGSFTGAIDDKKGLFELADGGTLFLDELGEMPLNLQAKLLRALQEGEIRPVGSNVTKKVDTRIVAATNRDLETEVKAGRFREDLYYRLKVFPLRLPPLRERREDIPLLASHFLKKYVQEFGRQGTGFSQQAMELLQSFDWPGNVRELENEVQRIVIQMEDGDFVQPELVSQRIRKAENVIGRVQPTKGTLKEMVEQVEKWILLEALRDHNNNKSATAKTLGITREGLHKKLKGFGIG